MKKLLLTLGAVASVAAPVAAVVACGTGDNSGIKAGDLSVNSIANAFTASLNQMDKNPQTDVQSLRNFNQFIAYVNDVVNGTKTARYLSGPVTSAEDVKDISAAAGVTDAIRNNAKEMFDRIALVSPTTYTGGNFKEATVKADKKAEVTASLEAINKKYPSIFKAALLLQIGHINVGDVTANNLVAHKGTHLMLLDQVNDTLVAAGYKAVEKSDLTGDIDEVANDAFDINVEVTAYGKKVLAFGTAAKAREALLKIAKLA